jgi:hypothetical protein
MAGGPPRLVRADEGVPNGNVVRGQMTSSPLEVVMKCEAQVKH